MSLLSLHDY